MTELLILFYKLVIISLITFGGGAQALLENLAVTQMSWLSSADFASGLALAYTTPGPNILITPLFIGYKIGGIFGSLIGLLGIFLTPAIIAGLATRHLERKFQNDYIKAFESGARAAIIGLLLVTIVSIYTQVESKFLYSGVVFISFLMSIKKINPALLLIGGALLGIIFKFL